MTPANFAKTLVRFADRGHSILAPLADRASFGALRSGFSVLAAGALLSACAALPATGPKSDAIQASATAGLRSTAALPYALVDVSADTIGFLSQPNLELIGTCRQTGIAAYADMVGTRRSHIARQGDTHPRVGRIRRVIILR